MRLVACQAEIASARPAVGFLEPANTCSTVAAAAHCVVEALLALGQRMVLVGAEHQPRLDAPIREPGAALVLVIGLIGVTAPSSPLIGSSAGTVSLTAASVSLLRRMVGDP